MNGYVSIVVLFITGVLCTLGVFHPHYKDTLGERIGMSLIAIWCFARVGVKLHIPETEPIHLMLHTGLFIFTCSHALAKVRVWHLMHRSDLASNR